MGDAVERALEETVPILRAAQRARLLSQSQVTDIVRKRRNHEYAVSSPSATRDDFLRYAAFERQLAHVIRKRAEHRNKNKPKTQRIIGKSAARVNLVYSRAVKKFRGDDQLWLHYAKHCLRTGAHRVAGRLFAKAIAFRPDSERVWLAAVAFHFDTCADAKGGRALAQKALRALPKSLLVWKEYFRLEVLYLAKLISRRVALGLTMVPGESDPDVLNLHNRLDKLEGNKQHEQQPVKMESNQSSPHSAHKGAIPFEIGTSQATGGNGQLLMDTDQSNASTASTDKKSGATPQKKLSFWHGGVPMTVFRNACDHVSLPVDCCAEIWNIVATTPFVPIQLMESMAAALTQTNATSIATALLHARLRWDIAHAQFDIERASTSEQKQDGPEEAVKRSANLESMKNSLAQSAQDVLASMKSIMLAQLSVQQNSKAKSAAIICLDGFKDVVKSVDETWQIIEQVAALRAQVSDDTLVTAPASEEPNISKTGVASLTTSKYGVDDLMGELISTQGELSDSLFEMFRAKVLVPFRDLKQERVLCEWLSREDDVQRLRQVCDLFLPLPPKTIGSIRVAIEAEIRLWTQAEGQSHAHQDNKEEFIARTRRMFKLGTELSAAKRDQDLWLDFIEFERKMAKDSKQANIVMRKASRVLDKASFELLTERIALRNLRP